MLDEMCGLELRSYQRPGSVGVMVVTESYRRWYREVENGAVHRAGL